jgi:peptide chain release factor 3
VPIFTFMNKLDRPARPSLDLLDELETVLGIHAFPVNWPLGDGPRFKGVYDREQNRSAFSNAPCTAPSARRWQVTGIEDESVREAVEEDTYRQVCDELELLEGAGADFDVAEKCSRAA